MATLRPPAASAEEAAAILAAVEQFRRDTAPPVLTTGDEPALSAWKRAALAEAVSRQPDLSL